MAQSNLKEKIIDFTNVLTGGQTKSKQLYFQLKNSIDKAKRIDIIVSFLMESGVRLLLKDLKQAVAKKIPIRIFAFCIQFILPFRSFIGGNRCNQLSFLEGNKRWLKIKEIRYIA